MCGGPALIFTLRWLRLLRVAESICWPGAVGLDLFGSGGGAICSFLPTRPPARPLPRLLMLVRAATVQTWPAHFSPDPPTGIKAGAPMVQGSTMRCPHAHKRPVPMTLLCSSLLRSSWLCFTPALEGFRCFGLVWFWFVLFPVSVDASPTLRQAKWSETTQYSLNHWFW